MPQERYNVAIDVAPLTGAWIEIVTQAVTPKHTASLPSRERGLKYVLTVNSDGTNRRSPLTGAWIEIRPALSV